MGKLTKIMPLVLLCGAGVLPESLQAKEPKASEAQCQRWSRQLQQVENQLRAGYTAEQGNRLKERQRQLVSNLRNRCD